MRLLVIVFIAVVVLNGLLFIPVVDAECLPLAPLATLSVGVSPRALVADPQRQRVYVANSGENTISVIDSSSSTVIATWSLTGPILTIGLNPVTGALYVAYAVSEGQTEVWMIDPENGQPVRGLWFPWTVDSMAVNARLQRVYLAGRWTPPNAISWERLSAIDSEMEEEFYTAHASGSTGGLTGYSGVAVDEATGAVYVAHR
jgi:YVTN family beta-propeller protein